MSQDSISSVTPRTSRRRATADLAEKLVKLIRRLAPPDSVDESLLATAQGELRDLCGPQATLSLHIPGLADDLVQSWLGRRWLIWPDGIPSERRWSFPSSRLSRSLDREVDWFRRLRAACDEAHAAGGRVVLVAGTAGEQLVRHAAVRSGMERIEVRIDEGRESTVKWVRASLDDRRSEDSSFAVCRLWLGPGDERGCRPELAAIPLRDRTLVILGEELRPLTVRPGGHTARLLATLCPQSPPASRSKARVKPAVDEARGATEGVGAVGDVGAAEVLRIDEWPWPALVHWTRRREGPWFGQSDQQYWDELLEERPERDRSALAVLERIVLERRLRASWLALRGGESMVCWAEVTPTMLAAQRVFRVHRHRWDFEPYGLAVDREWLERTGARKVIYGDDALWERLSENDRPWFQQFGSRTPRSGRSIDWRVEQEWRVRGDVDLTNLPREAAIVFVPDAAAARAMALVSPWPVRIVPAAPLPESPGSA